MSRVHAERVPESVNMGGTLKDELRKHARERCRHFFLYVFLYKALTDWVNGPLYNLGLSDTAAFFINASHQADEGFRSAELEHYQFNAKDPKVVDQDCTSCGRMDASHFCNLGITKPYQGKFSIFAQSDQTIAYLYGTLTRVCSNTRQLPQRVNIGPDKRVDRFHGDLATSILKSGKPVVSVTNLKAYLDGVTLTLTEYKNSQTQSGNYGVAACVDAYLQCYLNDGAEIWHTISGNVTADCLGLKLNESKYLSLN